MQLHRPFRAVTTSLDGEVLFVLAGADAGFTPPQVHALLGEHSVEGVRRALQRMCEHGLVQRHVAIGNATMYRLNRDHLLAEPVIAIAQVRQRFLATLRHHIEQWEIPCVHASLFGSAARGEMRPDSDIDLLVVRPDDVPASDSTWETQLADIEDRVTRWTGNDARVLELTRGEVSAHPTPAVVVDAIRDGVALVGANLALLRRTPVTT